MYDQNDTIYALASGLGVAGVAVIRISGAECLTILKKLTTIKKPEPNRAYYATLSLDGTILDKALVLYFHTPHSFTGEDILELQVHGGRGVVQAVCNALSSFKHCRPAERGEFSRRAVINGKMDLTEAEGLLDLIHAETEQQRRQAFAQMDGNLSKLYESWREKLVHHLAYAEAFIDFPEEDIPHEKEQEINSDIQALIDQIQAHLNDERRGERLREGFQIAILGAPNVGKSSLINALTHKEVAIVSQIAGTTRDIVEAHLDVDGFPVILADTAGLRESAEQIEAEGIRRAVKKAEQADLILFVQDATLPKVQKLPKVLLEKRVITIWNKKDLVKRKKTQQGHYISAKTGAGVTALWDEIKQILHDFASNGAVITRERYRVALNECVASLQSAMKAGALELKTEDLRMATRALGRITGRIEVDELLDVIFRDFCIGK
ncbi:MAG: tRNA uridine-5-carboxymethylaminomethyl(34) synthesis GTPase MnmE [Alphaproteobacteria bacterium]|nr:tRNA uridine-5-carboxymethylaminomethyl(34) synthesis GTPase MnmE [Alphaproteobacteria bacterium]